MNGYDPADVPTKKCLICSLQIGNHAWREVKTLARFGQMLFEHVECPIWPLGLKVPGYGKIGAIKKGAIELEYLLNGGGVVSWLSHTDIKAMLDANK